MQSMIIDNKTKFSIWIYICRSKINYMYWYWICILDICEHISMAINISIKESTGHRREFLWAASALQSCWTSETNTQELVWWFTYSNWGGSKQIWTSKSSGVWLKALLGLGFLHLAPSICKCAMHSLPSEVDALLEHTRRLHAERRGR